MFRVTQETASGIQTLIEHESFRAVIPAIIKAIKDGGIINVFTAEELALVIDTDSLKNNKNLKNYELVCRAMKHFEINSEFGTFYPTVKVA